MEYDILRVLRSQSEILPDSEHAGICRTAAHEVERLRGIVSEVKKILDAGRWGVNVDHALKVIYERSQPEHLVNGACSMSIKEPSRSDADSDGFVDVWNKDLQKWEIRLWFDSPSHPGWTPEQRDEITRRWPFWRKRW